MAIEQLDDGLESLIDYIKENRGFDFTGYKRPSLRRRFEKRMQHVRRSTFPDYQSFLAQHPDEFAELFDTILINVTSFFRDPPAWEFLREEIVPKLVETSEEIRVWSAGCASGEEAYSLAICLAEALPESAYTDRVKIYATDVDEQALAEGRRGDYDARRLENVPATLRDRYFEENDNRWTVVPALRRAVIFGRHDVAQDPPISRIDLLASRNTIMYFTAEAQSRILANFHFALRNHGFLFLGKSEMMLARSGLFTPVELKRRVFVKVIGDGTRGLRPAPPLRPAAVARPAADAQMRAAGFETGPIAQLVVDQRGRLTLANLQARSLFKLAPQDIGREFKELELSYRPVELRSQIDRSLTERRTITLGAVEWIDRESDRRVFDVHITPLVSASGGNVGVGISFVDVTRYTQLRETVEHSKRDVEVAYEELQSTVEELETTNEELQSTNEELETTNEELQSTNEELETMNEELQSTNEELETINDELNLRTDELNQLNFFLESVLGGLDAGVAVVDEELRVTAWNDAAQELWGLRADEVHGQHLMNLDIGLQVAGLAPLLRAGLAGEPLEPVTVQANDRRGRAITCHVRLSPLTGPDATPRGLIVFMEPEPQ